MAKNLVIVESPAKKKIIQGFLGKDFVVESSVLDILEIYLKKEVCQLILKMVLLLVM